MDGMCLVMAEAENPMAIPKLDPNLFSNSQFAKQWHWQMQLR
jgi:hypothetical protein